MSYTIKYYPAAEAEYLEAYNWYEEQTVGLGNRFENALGISLNHIANMPLSYPSKKAGRRECVMDDFPFIVVFKLYPIISQNQNNFNRLYFSHQPQPAQKVSPLTQVVHNFCNVKTL